MLPAPVAPKTLSELRLNHNLFSGQLPDAWGFPGAFPRLTTLSLGYNRLHGLLPVAWGGHDRLPLLQDFSLDNNALEGTIPDSWALPGAFAALIQNADYYANSFPSKFGEHGPRGSM